MNICTLSRYTKKDRKEIVGKQPGSRKPVGNTALLFQVGETVCPFGTIISNRKPCLSPPFFRNTDTTPGLSSGSRHCSRRYGFFYVTYVTAVF